MTKTTNTTTVTVINKPYSDIFVVNSARVSFSKESDFDSNGKLKEGDQRLLNYLASHGHWTPFSHVRETFAFEVDTFEMDWFIQSTTQEILASIVMAQGSINNTPYWVIRHSLYGWINLLNADTTEHIFQPEVRKFIIKKLYELYPGSMSAFGMFTEENYNSSELGKMSQYIADIRSQDEHAMYIVDLYTESRRDYFIDVTVREEVPIYVARQRFKHMIGFSFNESSRRYVDFEPQYFVPDVLRGRADNKKQGSTDTECKDHEKSLILYNAIIERANDAYNTFVDREWVYDMCPEQARGILPQAMMTDYYATGNLKAWERLIAQRLDLHAQKEIRDYAILLQDSLTNFL